MMIHCLIKNDEKLDFYTMNVVNLFHQTSDKKLLWMNEEGKKFLIKPKTRFSGSPDSHSEKAEVRTPAFNCQV